MSGIIDAGIKGYQDPSIKGFNKVADGEAARNATQRQLEAAQQQMTQQTIMAGAGMGMYYGMSEAGGAALGEMLGMSGGPLGMALGAGIGLLIDGLF
jgi:hypothetical protein